MTLSLAYCGSLDTDHIFYGLLSGSSDACQERLRSRCPFVSPAQNHLNNFAGLGICNFKWTNYRWHVKYCENKSRLHVYIPRNSARPVRMSLPQTVMVKLYHLQTDVGQFHLSMHKWGLTPSPNCECGTSEQTTDHILIAYLIHWAPHGAQGMIVLDNETQFWLNNIIPTSDLGSTPQPSPVCV